MPFSNTDSITSTDVNNMLRGLARDNTDNSHTGDTNKTDLASTVISGGTIGATGAIFFFAAGTVTGSAGNKTIDVDFGSFNVFSTSAIAGTSDWFVQAWIYNTATNAQRIFTIRSSHASGTDFAANYLASTIDTTANVTLRTRVTLANSGDTVTQTMWNVFVVQIT